MKVVTSTQPHGFWQVLIAPSVQGLPSVYAIFISRGLRRGLTKGKKMQCEALNLTLPLCIK